MRHLHLVPMTLALFLMISASACRREPGAQSTPAAETPQGEMPVLDARDFSDPTIIDNPWLPMQPGMHWVYEGTTTEDGETFAHRLEFTVTDLTKEIQGVQTRVAWIVDYRNDEVVEKEIAF